MARNVVVCLDGTNNQFKEDISNVVRLYQVATRDESQVAYYDPGVGTLADPGFKTPITRLINMGLGLSFGLGVTRNVIEAYSYLMDHYREGDRLFLFGFSRGAYTARVLAGFIHICGLLEPGCQNLIPYAIKLYKARQVDFAILNRFRSTFGRRIDIDFLGLWDSVSTTGWIWSPEMLPYTTNNPSVRVVRHALAIDERRSFFRHMPWGEKFVDQQDIRQVWFAGVHADVGGGYPEKESGLAKISLKWMLDEAESVAVGSGAGTAKYGLKIDRDRFDRYVMGRGSGRYIGPDSNADRHESMAWPWTWVQSVPRSEWLADENREAIRRPKPQREIPPGSTLHCSVLERMEARGYRPASLGGRSPMETERDFDIAPPPASRGAPKPGRRGKPGAASADP